MNKKFTGIIIVAILSTAVYFNNIKNTFQWDDNQLIKDNIHIRFLQKNLTNFFKPGYINLYEVGGGQRYRPLRTASFAFDYLFWKNNPVGYHLTNNFLHATFSVLVWWIVLLLTKNNLAAVLSAIIFAVHPVHTESVTYIKNRSDILCGVFFLLSFGFFIKNCNNLQNSSKREFANLAYAIFFFILSLLAKEMAITLPFLLAIYLFLFIEKKSRLKCINQVIMFISFVVIYALFRYYFLSGGQMPGIGHFDIVAFVKTVSDYIKIMFIPYPLYLDRNFVKPDIFSVSFLANVVIFVFFLILLFKSSKEKKFFLLFSIVVLLPVANIFFIEFRPFAEQRVYIPSVGICAFLGIIFARYFEKKYVKIIFVVFIIVFSFITVRRNLDYKDDLTLWLKTTITSPTSRAFNNLGTAYWNRRNYSEAIISWKKSIEYDVENADPYTNLGVMYFELKLYDKAKEYFLQTLKWAPNDYQTLSNLGIIYSAQGDYKKAVEYQDTAVKIAPWSAIAQYNLGVTYSRMGDYEKAFARFNETIELDPFRWQAYERFAELFEKFGKKSQAKEFFEKSQKIKNDLAQ